MANHKSAEKRARQTERRTAVNQSRKARIRTFVRKVEEAIAGGDKAAAEAAMRVAESEMARGAHVMTGYYENPAATAEVLQDGWLLTGDLGRLDEDNFLYITGRKKEILVTLGGKNIAPVYLESLLTEDPLIVQALVVGDGRPCLAALVVPNFDLLDAEIAARGIAPLARDEALAHPEVRSLVHERIRWRLKDVAAYEQVQQVAILPRGFTIEQGEMTAKLSLRRKVIEQHFAAEIESLYRRG
jgi:long-chain acyl-CoA synthetase